VELNRIGEEDMSDVRREDRRAPIVVDHVEVPVTISWGAVMAGAIASLAIWVMLYTLGLALGLSAVDPSDPRSLSSSGVFTGVWGLITPLIALFVGGMIAGAAARVTTKTGGVVHGLVMWAVTTLVGAWGLAMVLSTVVQGVASVGKEAMAAGAEAMIDGANLAVVSGVDAEQILRPVNERLAAEGKPAITPDQLQTAAQQTIQQAMREGRFDRSMFVESLTRSTPLSEQDASAIAMGVEAKVNEARQRVAATAQSLQSRALEAAEGTSKAMWGVFAALLLGMVSAIAGATIGEVRSQRLWEQWFSHDPAPRSLHRESVHP
jgi:hypothetical protein